jgi:hypothetical protein
MPALFDALVASRVMVRRNGCVMIPAKAGGLQMAPREKDEGET